MNLNERFLYKGKWKHEKIKKILHNHNAPKSKNENLFFKDIKVNKINGKSFGAIYV